MNLAALLAALAMALAVAGCGGGGGDTGSSDAMTKAAYVKAGDKICAEAEATKNKDLETSLAKLAKQTSKVTHADELNLVTGVALPPIAQMTEELAALAPPEEGAGEAEAIVAAFEDAVAEIESDPDTVLPGGGEPFAKPDGLAKAFGFKACSQI